MSDDSVRASAVVGRGSHTRRRILVYGTALAALALLQTTLMPQFQILGITPDLCLLLIPGIAMLEGPEFGGAFGLAAGFLECAFGGIGASALPILFFVLGYGLGPLTGRALSRTFPSYLILAVSICALRPAVTMAAIGLTAQTSDFDLTVILRGTLAPEFAVNFLFSLPMYPLCRKLQKTVQKKV